MPRHAATVCFSSPMGLLEVESADTGVTRVRLGARQKPREVGDGDALEYARKARGEILAYLEGDLKRFTVPVVLTGTPFQRGVWAKLLAIPYGKTRTYGEIAAELGKPRAARAVGTACGANPIPILVPCHRIVAGNGGLGGFGGGVRMKHELLELERNRGDVMRAYLIFTGSGPILILTTYPSVTDERLAAKMRHKGIAKFIAYEVPLERTRKVYGVPFEVIAADLAGQEDLRVLDFNGHHIFANFHLSELGEPIRHGD